MLARRMVDPLQSAHVARVPRALVLWLLGACLWLLLSAAFHDVRSDDAFITYRYGENLARGVGLVFNRDERILGFTSPGHTLLAALAYALFGRDATPNVMAVLGCAAWSAETVALYLLLQTAVVPAAAALCALLVALGAAGGASWVVLETHFVVAAVLFALWEAKREHWYSAAISCGIAVLFRPDAALAAALILGVCLWRQRLRGLGPCILFVALCLPWTMFASSYYGSPLPQSALTKFQRAPFLPYLMHVLSYPSQRLLWPESGVVAAWCALGLAGCGAWTLVRRGLWLLPAYGLLHATAYSILRPFIQHGWHLYPWVLACCACMAIGLAPIALNGATLRLRVLHVIRVALCVGLLSIAAWRLSTEVQQLAAGYWTGQRDTAYQRIARFLRARAARGNAFASIEVGTIGYYSDLRAFDLGGLVTRPGEPIAGHGVRFLVVDKLYPNIRPLVPPIFVASEGEFRAEVFELPRQ